MLRTTAGEEFLYCHLSSLDLAVVRGRTLGVVGRLAMLLKGSEHAPEAVPVMAAVSDDSASSSSRRRLFGRKG